MGTKSESAQLKNFGKRIRALRKERGISQERLALMSGLDRSYVGGVERGERNVSILNIWRLAEALKMNPGGFFE